MPKFTLFFALLLLPLWGEFDHIESYYATFTQKVVDTQNNTLLYRGTFSAKRPHFARWVYTYPTEKSVYIINRHITIVEPELEQAIVQEAHESFTLFNILKEAKKRDATTYEHTIEGTLYTLTVEGETLRRLVYTDGYDNRITIDFENAKPNQAFTLQDFKAAIPESYDVVTH
ncbi:MAG: hypothetical protein KU37_08735 [Sulfuricurvum sp. PC08-66]|nr:MAG: hypothetical protein KU37_08735 [Sulfuricurvum sp. PC08-66]